MVFVPASTEPVLNQGPNVATITPAPFGTPDQDPAVAKTMSAYGKGNSEISALEARIRTTDFRTWQGHKCRKGKRTSASSSASGIAPSKSKGTDATK